jgi:threonylcarbamoyladenosine tRNA methylthiotransferase MtaB
MLAFMNPQALQLPVWIKPTYALGEMPLTLHVPYMPGRVKKGEMISTMESKTIAITTLGCKVNQYDSATIEEALIDKGHRIVDFKTEADVYIINTCTVTHKTDYQSRQLIRRAQKKNPGAQIIVTGCYAQVSAEKLKEIPEVNLILGNREKQSIADFITGSPVEKSGPRVIVSNIEEKNPFKDPPLRTFSKHTRAFLKIQDGCESFCTYCIVPRARGKCRSLGPQETLQRLHTLSRQGFNEVVLTGIHLGAYGIDLTPTSSLLKVLQLIEREKPVSRIRISSLEPMDIFPDLVELIASSQIMCPHLHLPLQSGDSDILKRMNRPYTASDFQKLITMIVSKIPHLCLGVDVMVGFPGETETQFDNTYRLLEDLPVSYFHIFPYSKRENTPAASFPDHIPPETVRIRRDRLVQLNNIKKYNFYSSFLGTTVNVLLEDKRDRESGYLKGLSRNYIPVLIDGPDSLKNCEIEVEIVSVEEDRVRGRSLTN